MQNEIIFQLVLSIVLGALIGLEREYKKKEAGLRTYSLISLGSCLFTIIGFSMAGSANIEPTRVIQAVATGIGFIGAGLIMRRGSHIEGLTTAAGLWVAAAIGISVGSRLYFPAIFVTFLAIGILSGLRVLEEKYFHKSLPQ